MLYELTEEMTIDYDVPCGRGRHADAHRRDEKAPLYAELLRKRMDVLLVVQGTHYCGEVKRLGGAAALGQALLYAELYSHDQPAAVRCEPLVVCREIDHDCLALFRAHRVAVWEARSLSWVVPLEGLTTVLLRPSIP